MEKEMEPDVIKATQTSLGKYVKRPPLSDKLLKKPPFRFLHDIVTTVLKNTGFFEGLFDQEELISENVKDRESKILFLNKVIMVVSAVSGKSLTVKPSKIVAGQEPEKTNELLQCLAETLDKKISSDEAVRKYKAATKSTDNQTTEKKSTESSKTVKKSTEGKKLHSNSSEKLVSKKKEPVDQPLKRIDKDKSTPISKTKQKESTAIKKESPPQKKTAQTTKNTIKNTSVEKKLTNEKSKSTSKDLSKKTIENARDLDEISDLKEDKELQDEILTTDLQSKPPNTDEKFDNPVQDKLNSSYTIAENDLNSSLSSQDLMEIDNKSEGAQHVDNKVVEKQESTNGNINSEENAKETIPQEIGILKPSNSLDSNSGESEMIMKNPANKSMQLDNDTRPKLLRPPSVRPSSSRPGAPRLREKHENVVVANENLLVGKVNIIVENSQNDEEEDTSIVIVEQPNDPFPNKDQQQKQLQTSSNKHGHLVQQILDTEKEISYITGKTEIEWQFGAQKAREAVNQEIEEMRFNIQALSRVANPLGKLLDHIQEDVEVMRQELQQWTKTYEETSKELQKQKTANEDSLFPLHSKLKLLDTEIKEKRDKINDLKIMIHKKSVRIEKLLSGGIVQ